MLFGCCCRQSSAMYVHGIPHVYASVRRSESVCNARHVGQAYNQIVVLPNFFHGCFGTCAEVGHRPLLRWCGLEQQM